MTKTLLITLLICLAWAAGFGQAPKGKIIFTSCGRDNWHSALHIINSDGSDERALTDSGLRIDCSDYFQGLSVYMVTERDNKGASFVLTDITGTGVKTLIEHAGVCYPKWQPGGKLIAYENYPGGAQEIWVMDRNGTNKHVLVPNARHPYWYADGRKLLFTRDYEIYVYDMETGKEQQLTHLAARNILAKWPAISPNGKCLAFTAPGDSQHMGELGIIFLDSGGADSIKMFKNLYISSWTNDNKYLVSTCYGKNNDHTDVVLVNVETGEKTFVTHNQHYNWFPVWVSAPGTPSSTQH